MQQLCKTSKNLQIKVVQNEQEMAYQCVCEDLDIRNATLDNARSLKQIFIQC